MCVEEFQEGTVQLLRGLNLNVVFFPARVQVFVRSCLFRFDQSAHALQIRLDLILAVERHSAVHHVKYAVVHDICLWGDLFLALGRRDIIATGGWFTRDDSLNCSIDRQDTTTLILLCAVLLLLCEVLLSYAGVRSMRRPAFGSCGT